MHSVYCNSLLAAFFSCKTESNKTQITLLKKKNPFCLSHHMGSKCFTGESKNWLQHAPDLSYVFLSTQTRTFCTITTPAFYISTHRSTWAHSGCEHWLSMMCTWCCFCIEKPRGTFHFKAQAGLQGLHEKQTREVKAAQNNLWPRIFWKGKEALFKGYWLNGWYWWEL